MSSCSAELCEPCDTLLVTTAGPRRAVTGHHLPYTTGAGLLPSYTTVDTPPLAISSLYIKFESQRSEHSQVRHNEQTAFTYWLAKIMYIFSNSVEATLNIIL